MPSVPPSSASAKNKRRKRSLADYLGRDSAGGGRPPSVRGIVNLHLCGVVQQHSRGPVELRESAGLSEPLPEQRLFPILEHDVGLVIEHPQVGNNGIKRVGRNALVLQG